jgi:hypothetical protein
MSMANGELPKATEEISDAIKTPLPRSVGDAGLTEERVLAARDVAASCPSMGCRGSRAGEAQPEEMPNLAERVQ